MKKYILNKWNSFSVQGQMLIVIISLSVLHIIISLIKFI